MLRFAFTPHTRPTGYRWINRNNEVVPEGLLDLSRKQHLALR